MAHATLEPGAPQQERRAAGAGGVVVVGGAVAAFVAGGLTLLSGARPAAALGLPDPGTVTSVGLPVVRAIAEVGMVVTIGAILLAAFLVPPQRSGYLDVGGYRALRVASWSAGVWAAAALLLVPLTAADALGRPVVDVLDPGLLVSLIPRLETTAAWGLTGLAALVVLAGTCTVLTWGWSVVLFGVAVLAPLPVTFTGHAAGSTAHDLASDSLMLHVLAASVWVGGLVAVLGLGVRRDPGLAVAVPRFSRLALACWAVVAITGVVNALVRIPIGTLLGSAYGALVIAKAAALLVLGGLGYLHRRSTVAAAARGEPRALLRMGGVEVLLMLATVGLAVVLGRTAPPDTGAGIPSRVETAIGYDLAGPPTFLRLAFDWRFDLVFGTAAILMALAYLLGVRRLRARGDRWGPGRTAVWLIGCAALLVATSSGLGRYGPAMFSVHMGQHMMLGMLVPILLVLGAPVTLALRALPGAGRDGVPGAREWVLAAVHSPAAKWLTHPLVVTPLFVGSYYVLYFSGLFPAALPLHWAHKLMNLHFLVTGLLFFWLIVGVDPTPRRLPSAARLGLVFISVPFHAFFGVAVMSANSALGGEYYRGLALPWVSDPLVDQRLGGGLAWAAGEIPLLVVVVALLIQWSRQDERSARRDDRRADVDGDADLRAYNAMLRRLATQKGALVAESDDLPHDAGHPDRGGAKPQGVETASNKDVSAGQQPDSRPEPARPFVARDPDEGHAE